MNNDIEAIWKCLQLQEKNQLTIGPFMSYALQEKKNSLLSGKEVKILKQKNFSQSDFILPFLFC